MKQKMYYKEKKNKNKKKTEHMENIQYKLLYIYKQIWVTSIYLLEKLWDKTKFKQTFYTDLTFKDVYSDNYLYPSSMGGVRWLVLWQVNPCWFI